MQKADINYADWHTTYINGVSNGKISQMSSESVKETTGKLKITRGFIPKDIFNLAETLFPAVSVVLRLRYGLLTEAESGVKGQGGRGACWSSAAQTCLRPLRCGILCTVRLRAVL